MAQHCLQAIILAAGKSTRFGCDKTKLSFPICGQEMIVYPIKLLANELKIQTTLVLGYQKETIIDIVSKYYESGSNFNLDYVEQKEQLGTAHAVLTSKKKWFKSDILIINGDMPLITADIIKSLIEEHFKNDATISFVVAYKNSKDSDYGRVIKREKFIEIVEAREFDGNATIFNMINAGIYLVKKNFLEEGLNKLQSNNKSSEFYITDLIKIATSANKVVKFIEAPFDKIIGVNTFKDLSIVQNLKRKEIINDWMDKGVRLVSPETTKIDVNCTIESDSVIGAYVELRNNTKIAASCFIDSFSIIENSQLKESVVVHPYSFIKNSIINSGVQIGPYAHIRNESVIDNNAVIGNFVEVNKTFVGKQSKAKHLSYLANAQIGSHVNIGAGTITCNYNGFTKENTHIEDNVFVGSNCCLVAPINIGNQAIIGAGSVITKNVPSQALALSRAEQINKEEYAPKIHQKYKAKKRAHNADPKEVESM